MKIIVLGGGALRRGRTARSTAACRYGALAVGAGDGQWVLLNVSAAVALQLAGDAVLETHAGLIDARTRAIVLTDAQIDHIGGLIGLRDGPAIELYATPAVFDSLTTAWPVLPMLQSYCDVRWHVIPVAGDRRLANFRIDGVPTLEFTAIAVAAPALAHASPADHPRPGDHIAIAVRDLATGQRLFCAPGLAAIGGTALDWMREADCLLLDGADTKLDAAPWIDLVGDLPARHKVLLSADSDPVESAALVDRGIELAYDGMEIEL